MDQLKVVNPNQQQEDFDRLSLAVQSLRELLLATEKGECDKPVYLIANDQERQLIKATIASCCRQLLGLLSPVGIVVDREQSLDDYVRHREFCSKTDTANWFGLIPDPRGYRQKFQNGLILHARYLSKSEVEHIMDGTSTEYTARMKAAFQYDV